MVNIDLYRVCVFSCVLFLLRSMTGRDENSSEVRRAWRLVETQYIESRVPTPDVSLFASASNEICHLRTMSLDLL